MGIELEDISRSLNGGKGQESVEGVVVVSGFGGLELVLAVVENVLAINPTMPNKNTKTLSSPFTINMYISHNYNDTTINRDNIISTFSLTDVGF